MAGATAAVGSSVVKVPLAVCVRSVQAGVYSHPLTAAQSIVQTAGVRSLFTVRTPLLTSFQTTMLQDSSVVQACLVSEA